MTEHIQPDWSDAPSWAQWWAMDSDGYAYWYRDQPTFKNGTWLRPLEIGEEEWMLLNLETGKDRQLEDQDWLPEGFDNLDIDWNIEWDKTLRRRP